MRSSVLAVPVVLFLFGAAPLGEDPLPEIAARLHGCRKLPYETLRNVLVDLGVDLGSTASAPRAGGLLRDGAQVLGAPNFAARQREVEALTTAGATKLFDLFVQAAPEIIDAMPLLDRCQLGGVPTVMFDDLGRCTALGISCLQGFMASGEQEALCDRAVVEASSPEVGRIIAVATVLAAAHTCE